MAESRTFTCDVCGAVKKEANHWWVLGLGDVALHLYPWGDGTVALVGFDQGKFHLCGHVCVLRKVEEFMGTEPAGLANSATPTETGSAPKKAYDPSFDLNWKCPKCDLTIHSETESCPDCGALKNDPANRKDSRA